MKYSIIVPIYNVEKYLSRCIDSIINQTFPDFEVLLIDDGSQDGSLSICKKYEKLDRRIKIYSKENAGASSARNLGLEKAQGDKILFIDSDDYIESNMLEKINNHDADLIVYNSNVKKTISINKTTLDYDYFCGYLMKEILFSPCNKAFCKNVISEYDIRFDKTIEIGEDMLFTYDYLRHVNSVEILNDNLYHYVIRNDSTMNNSKKDYLQQYILTLDALKKKIGENIFVLSSWAADVSAIILVRKFISKMNYKDFKAYMNAYEKTNIYTYAVRCNDSKSTPKKILIFLLKHRFYCLLFFLIRVRKKC